MTSKLLEIFGAQNITLRDIDEMMKKKYDITLGEMSPDEYLNDCKVPVFFSQTKNDEMTEPSDI